MGGGAATLAMGRGVSLFAAYFSLAMQDTIPRRKWMCRKCVSALGEAEKITRPAMILAGSMDVVAPPSKNARRIYDAIPSLDRKYRPIEDATHCQFSTTYGLNTACGLGEAAALLGAGKALAKRLNPTVQQQHVIDQLVPWLLSAADYGVPSLVWAGTNRAVSSARTFVRS
jgi:hypothetical protein